MKKLFDILLGDDEDFCEDTFNELSNGVDSHDYNEDGDQE